MTAYRVTAVESFTAYQYREGELEPPRCVVWSGKCYLELPGGYDRLRDGDWVVFDSRDDRVARYTDAQFRRKFKVVGEV